MSSISQPYTKLVLQDEASILVEVSPATRMDGFNAVQLSAVVYSINGGSTLTIQVQASNDAENWTTLTQKIRQSLPGFSVMTPETGVATQFMRVIASLDRGNALLAVTQSRMKL